MGSYKNTDNLGTTLQVGDHIGYIYGRCDHYRIHSGTVVKLCKERVWVKPDEDFINDMRITDGQEDWYAKYHPGRKITKYDKLYLAPYGRVVKLGY